MELSQNGVILGLDKNFGIAPRMVQNDAKGGKPWAGMGIARRHVDTSQFAN
jgi:hypothetical protein